MGAKLLQHHYRRLATLGEFVVEDDDDDTVSRRVTHYARIIVPPPLSPSVAGYLNCAARQMCSVFNRRRNMRIILILRVGRDSGERSSVSLIAAHFRRTFAVDSRIPLSDYRELEIGTRSNDAARAASRDCSIVGHDCSPPIRGPRVRNFAEMKCVVLPARHPLSMEFPGSPATCSEKRKGNTKGEM